MNHNEYMLDWYESHILLPNDKNKRICPYCNQIFGFKSWQKHMEETHLKSIEEMLEECCFYHPLPLCANSKCNKPMTLVRPGNILGGLREFCSKQCAGERASQRLKDPAKSAKLRKVLSERMTRLNNDQNSDFSQSRRERYFESREEDPHIAARGIMRAQYTRTKGDTLDLYLLDYGDYIKVGVSENTKLRLTHLYGFKSKLVWEDLPKAVALSIEYSIKIEYDNYRGRTRSGTEATEVFFVKDKTSIVHNIEDWIDQELVVSVLSDWIDSRPKW